MKLKKYQALLISIIVPCLITFVGMQSSYWFSLKGSLDLIEKLCFFVAICVGTYTFSQIEITSKSRLIMAWLAYLLGLAVIIFVISLITACSNGDCL